MVSCKLLPPAMGGQSCHNDGGKGNQDRGHWPRAKGPRTLRLAKQAKLDLA
jgi:hypothetical protein